jgi:RNA polymerase sigma factor (sigma-70 family)
MTPDELDFLKPIVSGVALEFSRRFHKAAQVEYADVEQECWVWCIKHPTKVSRWMKEEDGHRPIRTSLRNVALDYCSREKAARLGYDHDDLYWWSKGDVEVALGAMFSYEDWLSPPQSEGRSNKSAAEGGNYIATLADLSRAFDQLNAEDRKLLTLYYRDEEYQRDIAEDYGVSQKTISVRIDGAVRRLADKLGGPAPRQGAIHDPDPATGGCECGHTRWGGPGSRKVLSGAAARAITSSSYDGQDA